MVYIQTHSLSKRIHIGDRNLLIFNKFEVSLFHNIKLFLKQLLCYKNINVFFVQYYSAKVKIKRKKSLV